MTTSTTPPWRGMSRADFDLRLAAKGHRKPADPGLFYVATPEAAPKPAPVREELPGQAGLFGTDDTEEN